MNIFLLAPNGEGLYIPVNPPEIVIRRGKLYETVTLLNLGEVDFAHGAKVTEITFSSFFPAEYDPSYCQYAELPDPQEAMNKLTKWMGATHPVRLIITGTIINVLVNISAHDSNFQGGEPGDVYYDLTCRTWREVKVRKIDTQASAKATTKTVNKPATATKSVSTSKKTETRSRTDIKPIGKTYVVQPGDSLYKIAKIKYGDGSKFKVIHNANRKLIGPDPDKIKPGMKLVLPSA